MSTVRQIVTRALQRIGVVAIATGESAHAEYAAHALAELNDMMHGWTTQGLDFIHTDWTLNDSFILFVPPRDVDGDTVAALASQGTWNASTNTPTLASSTGTKGYYYTVATAGGTDLDDVTSWSVNDVAVFDGEEWLKSQSARKHEGGVVAMLAARLAGPYSYTADPGYGPLVREAERAWTALAADWIIPPKATFDTALVRTQGRAWDQV